MPRGFLSALRRMEAAFQAGPQWLPSGKRKPERYVSATVMLLVWFYGFLDRLLTPQGRIFGAVYLGVAFYSTILTRSPATILFFILTATLFFDFLGGLLFFPHLRITRHVPARVACGTEFQIRYTVFNRSFLPCYDLSADSSMQFRNLTATDTAISRLTLPPKQTGTLIRRFKLTKRGIYQLPCAVLETAFPFQILKFSRILPGCPQIICHPACTELRTLRLPDGSTANCESLKTVSSEGSSMDFYGCREYRTGDDPRKIHWAASAGRPQFVVKEFQEEKLSRAALILDNAPAAAKRSATELLHDLFLLHPIRRRNTEDAFEAAVSLTASIAASLSSGDFAIDIFAAGSELHRFRTGRGGMTQESFLDLLASLEPERRTDRFRKITPEDIRAIASTGAVFLILLSIDDESEKLHRAIAGTGAAVRTFLISDSPGPAWTEHLIPSDILSGKAGEL